MFTLMYGVHEECLIVRKEVVCHLYLWLLEESLDVSHEAQKQGSPNLTRVEENGRESDGQENQKVEIR